MRAMLLEQIGDIDSSPLKLRDIDAPLPGKGELRVRVSVCAVCRTDLHIIEGDLPQQKLPLVPGHQIVGYIDQVGEGCTRFQGRVGDRVGIAWLRSVDGTCRLCQRGLENLCPESRYTGYHEHGGYAEYAVAPQDFVYPLADLPGVDDAHVSPLLCGGLIGYRALDRAAVPDGGKLLLVGFGSSAHLVAQFARHRGYEVYVLSRTKSHQKMALEMGAAWAGDDAGDLPCKVDSAILFAPVGKLIPGVLEVLDRAGTLSIAGIHLSDCPPLNYEKHLFYEKQVRSVTANTRDDAYRMLREAAEAKVQPMVTLYDLADANRALADMKHSRTDGTGVLQVGG